jgi:hypothetical protein
MILTGENRSTRRQPRFGATFPTVNPPQNDPGSNSGLHGERRETNGLNHEEYNYVTKYGYNLIQYKFMTYVNDILVTFNKHFN